MVDAGARDTYQHIQHTSQPEVLSSWAEAQSKIEDYVRNSLSMKRLNEAKRIQDTILPHVRTFVEQHAAITPPVAPRAGSGDAKEEEAFRLQQQFNAEWKVSWDRLLGDCQEQHYKYMHEEKEDRMDEIRQSYQSLARSEFAKAEAHFKAMDPRRRVMRSATFYGQVSITHSTAMHTPLRCFSLTNCHLLIGGCASD